MGGGRAPAGFPGLVLCAGLGAAAGACLRRSKNPTNGTPHVVSVLAAGKSAAIGPSPNAPYYGPALLAGRHRILVTGGAGFIGGAVVRRLLQESEALVFNLDKCGYASDLTSIEQVLAEIGPQTRDTAGQGRHTLLRVDLTDAEATAAAVQTADPDLVRHLAAESHWTARSRARRHSSRAI